MTSAMGFKVRVSHLLPVCDGFLRIIFGVTPAEFLAVNMLANSISHILLQAVVGGQRDSRPDTFMPSNT